MSIFVLVEMRKQLMSVIVIFEASTVVLLKIQIF